MLLSTKWNNIEFLLVDRFHPALPAGDLPQSGCEDQPSQRGTEERSRRAQLQQEVPPRQRRLEVAAGS